MASRNLKPILIALMLYSLLSMLLTYPLVFHMNDSVSGSHDVWHYLWNIWWVKTSLLELHASPYYSEYIFHPTGADLRLHELSILSAVIALPFDDIVFAYNVLCLLSFILAGLGMYLLARYITRDEKAAFISGLIYGFAPYHIFELSQGHLNLLTIEWIPFYVLFLIKTVRENERKNLFYGAFFLLLVSLSTWQYALYTLLFTLLYLSHLYLNKKDELLSAGKRIVTLFLLYLLLVAPFLIPTILSLMEHEYITRGSLSTIMYYSSDALSIFLPNSLHPLYGRQVNDIFTTLTADRIHPAVLSIGYVALLLAGYYVIRREAFVGWIKEKFGKIKYTHRVKKLIMFLIVLNAITIYLIFGLNVIAWIIWSALMFSTVLLYYLIKEKKISFWILSTLAFWVLSMGPVLQFLGRMYFPLPYIYLLLVPLIRAPYRAVVIFNLSVALLAGKGIAELNKKTRREKLMALVVGSIILFEFLSIPIPLSKADVPSFYYELAADSKDYALLDVQISPLSLKTNESLVIMDMPQYMYYQTIHHKKIVGGIISGIYPELIDFLDNTPVLHQLRYPSSDEELRENANAVLRRYNIRYVIVHYDTMHFQDIFQKNTSGKINHTLGKLFPDNEIVYSDSKIHVIKVKEA